MATRRTSEQVDADKRVDQWKKVEEDKIAEVIAGSVLNAVSRLDALEYWKWWQAVDDVTQQALARLAAGPITERSSSTLEELTDAFTNAHALVKEHAPAPEKIAEGIEREELLASLRELASAYGELGVELFERMHAFGDERDLTPRQVKRHLEVLVDDEAFDERVREGWNMLSEYLKVSHRAACHVPELDAFFVATVASKKGRVLLSRRIMRELGKLHVPRRLEEPEEGRVGRAPVREWYRGIEIEPNVFYANMPNDVYHALPGVSKSGLDLIDQSPAHYKYAPPRTASRAMELGTAIHAALLEPDLFESEYLVLDGVTTRTSTEYRQAVAVRGTETTLTEFEGAKVLGMQQAAYDDPNVRGYLQRMKYTELSGIFGDAERPELWRRIRIDGYVELPPVAPGEPKRHILLDVKKTQDAREESFMRSVTNYRYHVQSAFYADTFTLIAGEPCTAFVFIAIEENAPHGIRIYIMEDEALTIGLKEAGANLGRYQACVESGVWPCYNSAPSTISLTNWALKEARETYGGLEDESVQEF